MEPWSATTAAETGTPPLSLCLFGPLEVRLHGAPLPHLRSRKGHWLLALLALRTGRELERSWLAGTLWPDSSQSQALSHLRKSLLDLRRALGPEACRLASPSPQTLCLDLSSAEVDLLAFDRAIACGDAPLLERAVRLYRGQLLEGCAEEWVLAERSQREQAYLTALEHLADHARSRGDAATAEQYLRQVLAVDPLREGTQRALMETLAGDGHYAAATQVYRELRLLLHRELNAAPAPETQALFEQLRAQARRLAQAVPATALAAAPPASAATSPLLPEGTVTFLFTDIEGSTRLWEQHPEAMRRALARHHELVSQGIEAHGGSVITRQGEGDSFFAVFARAGDAVAAACALQRELQAERWPEETLLRVRMALHTGEAELRGGDYFGGAVNRCARLRGVGHGGQTLLSQTTAALVRDELPEGVSLRDLGTHRLKDLQRPEPIFQLMYPELAGEFPPLRSLEAFAHNLPLQLTRFIGREREMEAVKRLLQRTRLLTLTGAGGCGKSRLALQVAAELVGEYAEGVWFVELAALSEPALVPQTLAAALGVREEPGRPLLGTLVDALRPRSLLLVLDNCEHLLPACAQLAEGLLRSCPNVRLLATSREGLGIAGEQSYRVPCLSVPDPEQLPPLGALQQYEAVSLFADRAILSQPEFAVTAANAAAVAQVCQRLDGIPLALELAAARVKVLPVEKIAARLDDRFRLLTGGSRTAAAASGTRRQQTLRALIDWSYHLLTEPERTLLRRLSVFAGGWTLEAVEAVCPGEGIEGWEILDLLTSLVEKSLVLHEEPGRESRYRLLETVREYGRECLELHGEAAAATERHARYFLAQVEELKVAARERGSVDQEEWFDQLDAEYAGLRLAAALREFWIVRGHFSAARRWLERILAQRSDGAPAAAWAGALLAAGSLAYFRGDYSSARSLLTESLAVARAVQEPEPVVWSLLYLGTLLRAEGDLVGARCLFEESLVVAEETGNAGDIAWSLRGMGFVASEQSDYAGACAYLERSLALAREIGDNSGVAWSLLNLADTARRLRDHARAATLYRESLICFEKTSSKRNLAFALEGLAWLVSEEGRSERAAQLLGAAELLREASGCPIAPSDRGAYDGLVAAVRTSLGGEAFAAMWAEGRAMTPDQATAYALDPCENA
jgi:predicted ATPase/class 3 adenylate cyclase